MALEYSFKTSEQTYKTKFSAWEGLRAKFNIAAEFPAVDLI